MMQLLRGALFAAALALWTPASAQAQAKEITPALFAARDADSTIYLFGTVHVRPPGAPWGGRNAQAALAEAEEVWTEIEISPETEAQGQALMLQYGAAPADRPLSSWLSAEENARLNALTERLGVPAGVLEGLQPWLAAVTLSILPMMQAGYDPNAGVDRAVDAAGDAAGKRMRAFETIEDQIRFLSGFSAEAQREMLLEAIAETEKGPAQLDGLSLAWERGDLETLERAIVDDTRERYPELYEGLFARRNAAWIEILMRELEGAGVDFVAVGAGHLLGEDGLVAQLRARGVRVVRVRRMR